MAIGTATTAALASAASASAGTAAAAGTAATVAGTTAAAAGTAAGAAAAGTAAAGTAAASGGVMSSIMSWMGAESVLGITNYAALNLGMAGVSVMGQLASGKSMEAAAEANDKSTMQSMRDQYAQLDDARREVLVQERGNMIQSQVDLLQQKASVEAMAGASGVMGGSVDSMIQDLNATGGRNQATIASNAEKQMTAISDQANAIATGTANQRNQSARQFEKPSTVSTITQGALGAATTVLGSDAMMKNLNKSYRSSRTSTSMF